MADSTELERMVVRLVGDGSLYQQMLLQAQSATKQAAANIASTTKQIEGFQGSIEGFAKGALGVLSTFGLVTSLRGAFNAYVQVDQAAISLRTTIESSGRDVKSVTDDYNEFTTQITAVTTATKGQIKALIQQAEMRGIEGDKAKQVVQTSVALTGILGGEASSHSHLAIAIQEGNLHMVKRALHLHNIKDQSELVAKVQKQLELGWKIEQEKAKSLGGQIDKLYNSLVAFSSEVGAVVAEYVRPLVEWLTLLTDAFKKLDPETKKITVAILTIGLTIPLLRPALSTLTTVLGTLFAPLTSAIGVVTGLLLSLLTPLGIITVTLLALGATFVNWSEVSGSAVSWLTERWSDLVKFFRPAIQGIQDALKAADLPLAFNILWVQIQLTFGKGIQPLRELWIAFIYQMQELWINMSSGIKSVWETTTSWIAKKLADVAGLVGIYTEAEVSAIKEDLDKSLKVDLDKVERQRKEALRNAENESGDSILKIQKQLEELEKERNRLIATAATEASKVPPIKVPEFKIPKLPDQNVKVHTKWDATEFGSAEALSRLAEFQLSLAPHKGTEGGGGGGERTVPRANAVETGSPDAIERVGNFEEATQTLKEIKDILGKDKSIKLNPAGLTT